MAATSERGFTLMETIVVIAIIAVASTGVFGLFRMERASKFDSDVQKTLSEIRQLQNDAKTVDNNREYGIQFMSNSYITFSIDPATGIRTNLKTQPLSTATQAWSVSGNRDQIVFERLTGKTQNNDSATLTYTLTNPSRSKVIKIDAPGVIYVQ